MELRITRRRLVATVLAIAFAAETVGVVAASFPGQPSPEPVALAEPAGDVLAAEGTPELPAGVAPAADAAPALGVALAEPEPAQPAVPAPTAATPAATPSAAPEIVADATPKATRTPQIGTTPALEAAPDLKPASKATSAPKAASGTKAAGNASRSALNEDDFAGSNHVWIPALGISKSVRVFPCDRNRPPDNYMYRWGCAGANNVYLLGHAYSAMEPLHDAYVSGRLHKGMKAFYAGPNGAVHTYVVKYWRVVLPTPDASWAWASQRVPSMTLQTCVGKNSKYRLMVRLVEVDG